LIVKELIGPWIFGVGMFSSLLMAATYLGRLAGFLVGGVPVTLVLELTAMYLPAMLVQTFSMAMLLSALLAFGRLSSDSEIVALRAGGASLFRIIRPVAIFSVLVASATFVFDEAIVPLAAQQAVAIEYQIQRLQTGGNGDPQSMTLIRNKKLALSVTANHVNLAIGELRGVAIIAYGPDGKPAQVMTADTVLWAGKSDPENFLIPNGAHITSLIDPRKDSDIFGKIWPNAFPKIGMTFGALVTIKDDDFAELSLVQLRAKILLHERLADKTEHDMANYEYGYWNKIAVPLAAVVFGCLGAVLGIRNHRTGTAAGFALAVAIIFGYFMLASFMSVWALGGVIPAWIASFSPLAIGTVATVVIMRRRNG
jgi:lipopolysaccharide export system permease protein